MIESSLSYAKSRDGVIKNTIKPQKQMPKFGTKKDCCVPVNSNIRFLFVLLYNSV